MKRSTFLVMPFLAFLMAGVVLALAGIDGAWFVWLGAIVMWAAQQICAAIEEAAE